MQALKVAVGAVALMALVGCGGGAHRIYRVSVDMSPLAAGKLPGSCYTTGTQPAGAGENTGLSNQAQWLQWDGPDGKQYLDVGAGFLTSVGAMLGNTGWSLPLTLIEGKDKSFSATAIEKSVVGSTTTTQTNTITVKFTEMGSTAKGNVDVAFKQECQGCTSAPKPEACSAALTFTGAQFQGDQMVVESI